MRGEGHTHTTKTTQRQTKEKTPLSLILEDNTKTTKFMFALPLSFSMEKLLPIIRNESSRKLNFLTVFQKFKQKKNGRNRSLILLRVRFKTRDKENKRKDLKSNTMIHKKINSLSFSLSLSLSLLNPASSRVVVVDGTQCVPPLSSHSDPPERIQ